MKKNRMDAAVAAVLARIERNGFAVLNSKGISDRADHKLFILTVRLWHQYNCCLDLRTAEGRIIVTRP